MNPVIMTMARQEAIKAVKQRLLAEGIKIAHVEHKAIAAAAGDYLRDHPELIDKAEEIVRKSPQLQKLAERYDRKRRSSRE